MRAVLCILAVACLMGVSAIAIGRPSALPLATKLMAKKARLGESLAGAAMQEQFESLTVAAAERETSLADKFAMDLAAHMAAKSAEKSEAEAVAGMDVEMTSGNTVQAEIVTADAAAETEMESIDVSQAAEEVAEAEAESNSNNGLNIETLQELEYQQSSTNAGAGADAGAAEEEVAADADAEAEKDKKAKVGGATKVLAKGAKSAKSSKSSKSAKSAKSKKAAAKPKAKAAAPKAKPAAKKVATTLNQAATKWYNCQFSSSPAAGVSTLKAVAFRAAPPLRDQAFAIEVDGTYKGPDVTYGSVTLQIARVRSSEPQSKDMPELVYRHSVVLSDVVAFNPFKQTDPLSATMYVPEAAFNMFAPAGDYIATVTFTNQDKLPFGCAKVDFKLE